jgi:hypothetical protein
MTSPVVVDGRVTREKLDELLRLAAEHTELEFKSFLDLSTPEHLLNLVKTLIGMANAGSGGLKGQPLWPAPGMCRERCCNKRGTVTAPERRPASAWECAGLGSIFP